MGGNYLKLRFEDLFNLEKRKITCGIEIEVYLLHEDGKLVGDINLTNRLLNNLPKSVTKDYYPYQLEIRTQPNRTADNMITELKETINLCHDEAAKLNLKIKFASWLGNNEMFNGLHFHVKMGKSTPYMNTIINSYPLVLSLASYFRCSPSGFNYLSRRIDNSPHCGLPNLSKMELISPDNRNRYRDMVINQFKDNNRQRLKSVSTLETRVFDVPCDWNYLKLLIRLLYEIFYYIKNETTIYDINKKNEMQTYLETASLTRDEICCCRHTKNYFFNEYNDKIVEKLCDKFNLKKMDESLIEFLNDDPLEYDLYNGFPFLKNKIIPKPSIIKKKFAPLFNNTEEIPTWLTNNDGDIVEVPEDPLIENEIIDDQELEISHTIDFDSPLYTELMERRSTTTTNRTRTSTTTR